MIPVNEKVEAKAQEMLERANAMTRPVDLKPILDKLKLELMLNPMGEEYSGFLAADKRLIVVNERHPKVRQRFTVAHEIGHYDLHCGGRNSADMFVDRIDYFRDDDKQEVYFRRHRFGPADYRSATRWSQWPATHGHESQTRKTAILGCRRETVFENNRGCPRQLPQMLSNPLS